MHKRLFFGILSGVVVLVLGVGLFLVGSPEEARLKKIDERRIGDLKRLESAVLSYHRKHDRLPQNLDEVAEQSESTLPLRDAQHGPYPYEVVDSTSFKVCAAFHFPSSEQQGHWAHASGEQCFTQVVD